MAPGALNYIVGAIGIIRGTLSKILLRQNAFSSDPTNLVIRKNYDSLVATPVFIAGSTYGSSVGAVLGVNIINPNDVDVYVKFLYGGGTPVPPSPPSYQNKIISTMMVPAKGSLFIPPGTKALLFGADYVNHSEGPGSHQVWVRVTTGLSPTDYTSPPVGVRAEFLVQNF